MLGEILISVLLGLPVLLALKWVKNSKIRNAVNKFPGPATQLLVGNAFQLGKKSDDVYRQYAKWATEFNEGVHRIWIGSKPVIHVYKAEYLDCVMSTMNSKKGVLYKFFKPWLREGLLLSYGKKWQSRRKMLTPSFHYSILEDFMSVFHSKSDEMLRILSEKAAENEEFDIYPYITRCTLDIICSTAMGVNLNLQEQRSPYLVATQRMSELIIGRVLNPLAIYDPIFNLTGPGREQARVLKFLHGFTRQVIEDRWREYEKKIERGENIQDEQFGSFGSKRRRALLDILIQNSMVDQSMTLSDIQEEVDTFMFEGHDTTTSAIGWSIYNLGRHQDWQAKIREEILQISPNGTMMTANEISQLRLLDCFLKESMRLFTTVPFINREVTEECKIGPYDCPKGVTIQVLLGILHRDPKYFPDPDRFDPERWMGDGVTKGHPFCYIPFSSGLRNCIGQKFALLEWKDIVIGLVKNFQIICLHDFDDIKEQSGEIILRPSKGLPVKLTKIC